MRRYGKWPRVHRLGDIRTITWFLWLPMTIGNETRWLETTTWEERCIATGGEVNPRFHRWAATRWVSR